MHSPNSQSLLLKILNCSFAGEMDSAPENPKTGGVDTKQVLLQQQASPQQQAARVKKGDSQDTILYKPVTAEAAKAFFGGIKKSATFSMEHLEANLPPPGVVLQSAPVAQVTPQEIAEVSVADQEYSKREDAILTRLMKMDEAEITAKLAKSKAHPLFKTYEQEVTEGLDACHTEWGVDCPHEDLCHFEMWLDDQAAAYRDTQQEQPAPQTLGEPASGSTVDKTQIEVDSPAATTALTPTPSTMFFPKYQTGPVEVKPAVTTPAQVPEHPEPPQQVDSASQVAATPDKTAVASSAVVATPPCTLVDPATPASYVEPVSPETMLTLENQLADLTLNPQGLTTPFGPVISPPQSTTTKATATATAATPKATSPAPDAPAFTPVTPDGVKTFWAALKRKSTDDLSMASPPQGVPSAPGVGSSSSAPATLTPPATSPEVVPQPANVTPPAVPMQPATVTPVTPPPATVTPPATPVTPPPATVTPPAVTLQPATVTVTTPAVTLQPATVTPVTPPPATVTPPAVTLQPATVTPVTPPPATVTPPAVTLPPATVTPVTPPPATVTPAAVTPQPATVTTPAVTPEPATVTTPAVTPQPSTSASPSPCITPAPATAVPASSANPDKSGDRAAYMRFYRSGRSTRAPDAVTKSLI